MFHSLTRMKQHFFKRNSLLVLNFDFYYGIRAVSLELKNFFFGFCGKILKTCRNNVELYSRGDLLLRITPKFGRNSRNFTKSEKSKKAYFIITKFADAFLFY